MSDSNITFGAGVGGINNSFAGNDFFQAEEESLNLIGLDLNRLGTPYAKLRPKGSGIIDVVNKMIWKNYGSTEEVPVLYITERELKYGTWTANLLQVLTQINNLASGQNLDSYLALYAAEKTGFSYFLPYLAGNDANLRNISNTWNRANGLMDTVASFAGSKGNSADIVGAAMGVVAGMVTPGIGYEETYQFGQTQLQELTVTFPLYNTVSQEAAFDHYSFVQLFTFQNLKTRTSLLTFIPPKIYTVDTFSQGGIYMAAAYVSNFKVDSIGTTRRMRDFSSFGPREILIPEAYRVSITFTDLISQSSNIFAGTMGGTKIEVTQDISDFINNVTSGAAGNFASGVFNLNNPVNLSLNGGAGSTVVASPTQGATVSIANNNPGRPL